MADPSAEAGPAASDKDLPTEDNIRVVCRFRPLNDSEEKAGSKFVVKFPDEQCVHVSVRKIYFLPLFLFKIYPQFWIDFFEILIGQSLHV